MNLLFSQICSSCLEERVNYRANLYFCVKKKKLICGEIKISNEIKKSIYLIKFKNNNYCKDVAFLCRNKMKEKEKIK